MKPVISNLHAALTFQLEGMYDAEKQIQKILPDLDGNIESDILRREVSNYLESASDKRIKLKRIFSYLLAGPYGRKNNVVKEQLKEASQWMELTSKSPLGDRLLIGSLQNLMTERITTYGLARTFAEELNLQPVADLLDEILLWEMESVHQLKKLAGKQIGKKEKGILQN